MVGGEGAGDEQSNDEKDKKKSHEVYVLLLKFSIFASIYQCRLSILNYATNAYTYKSGVRIGRFFGVIVCVRRSEHACVSDWISESTIQMHETVRSAVGREARGWIGQMRCGLGRVL